MLRKAVVVSLIVLGLTSLWLSTSRSAMEYISSMRAVPSWWGTYDWLYGDLAGMSYLDLVARFRSTEHYPAMPDTGATGNKAIYLSGDSYTRHAHLTRAAFAGAANLRFIDRGQHFPYILDTTKENILIMEISERFVRRYFGGRSMLTEFAPQGQQAASQYTHDVIPPHPPAYPLVTGVHKLFNKFINQNLECNLFNYNFLMPLFKSKAALNYYLFSRASGDVVISDNKDFLLLKETVAPHDTGSSYVPLATESIDILIANLDTIYSSYKSLGFKEVYLSIIPNPATIVQPCNYNNMIPLIQNDARLRMKVIDIYSIFKNAPQQLYLRGDTHWNTEGFQLWLNEVNRSLILLNN